MIEVDTPAFTKVEETEIARIMAKYRAFESNFEKGDIHTLVEEFYHPSVIFEGLDVPVHRGRDDLFELFLQAHSRIARITITLDDVQFLADDVALNRITNCNHVKRGRTEVHRGINIWQKFDGEWFCRGDFFFWK